MTDRVRADPTARTTVRLAAGGVGAGLVLRSAWTASDLGAPERWWAVAGVIALWLVLAWALPALRRLLPRPGDVPVVFAVVLLTSFLCIPETNQVLRVALVVTVLVVAEGVSRRRAPIVVVALAAAYVMWAGIFGATGRQSALVGVLFAWWPIVILPLLATWRPALARTSTWARGLVVSIGAAGALVVARTGALEPTVVPALVAVAIALPVSLAAAGTITIIATRRAHGVPHPSA